MESTAANPYLTGLFAPLREEVTAVDLPISGRLPDELTGRYLRNGPNPLDLDDPATHHWFLGDGMVHGVRLREGRAEWYRNRWVRSRHVAEGLGEQPPATDVEDPFDFGANTHVIGHAGRILALVESGPRPYELTGELETVGPCDFDGTLPGGLAAHTKHDPATGELHAVSYELGRTDAVKHVVIDAHGRVTTSREVPVVDGPMMHDFALTQRFVVLYDLPVTFSPTAAGLPYTWDPEHPARVGLLPRQGPSTAVRWFDVEACWVFHTLGAYEAGDEVVIDVCRYPHMFDVSRLAGAGSPSLHRWRLNPTTGNVTEQRVDERPQEFPRIDERRTTGAYRYAYTAGTGDTSDLGTPDTQDLEKLGDAAFGSTILKHDLEAGTTVVHDLGRDAAAGEPVFVPRASEAVEDDGYVLTFAHDPQRGATDLLVLAAQDLAAGPIAAVHLPVSVPLGFHGSWIPDAG